MNKVLLLTGICALTLMGACSKKTVEPVAQPKPAAIEQPAPAPSPSIYGAPEGAAAAPMSTSVTTTPEAPVLVADKNTHKKTTASKATSGTTHKAAAATGHGTKYVVKKGDTLSGIAKKHHSSVKKILAVNPGLKPNLIKVGQTIVLP